MIIIIAHFRIGDALEEALSQFPNDEVENISRKGHNLYLAINKEKKDSNHPLLRYKNISLSLQAFYNKLRAKEAKKARIAIEGM